MNDITPVDFEIVDPIDWARIARAHRFYSSKGFSYVETPWVVPFTIAQETMPSDANPFFVTSTRSTSKEKRFSRQVLVGSAEQGFVHLLPRLKPNIFYFSISPCFRGESDVSLEFGVTQLTFMKVELFCYGDSDQWVPIMHHAQEFMETEGVILKQHKTSIGYDLVTTRGLELGSYGQRGENSLKINYGTGLAEPRFSFAVNYKVF